MREGAVPPEFPRMFIKTMGALVGHDEAVVKPKASDCFDYEAELAVVIGKDGRHIRKENALDHVAGYTCLMDGSMRDWQQRTTDLGKNFWRSSSIGPWMVTPDEVPTDRTTWKIQGRLNGQVMQSSNIGLLVHGIEDLIENYSTMTELKAGDVIATGTCSGVGHARKPPVYLKPGDVFEIEIDGIGVLRNPVVGE
jgi:2-keto-4-pentenoate hydratase/2-oxohepta-3-ene-1,7-dioic acid hydratase in catechol pathway